MKKVNFVLEASTKAHYIDNFILIQINKQTIQLKLIFLQYRLFSALNYTFSAHWHICRILASVTPFDKNVDVMHIS